MENIHPVFSQALKPFVETKMTPLHREFDACGECRLEIGGPQKYKVLSEDDLRNVLDAFEARQRIAEVSDHAEDLSKENEMLRRVNAELGAEAETAEALIKRWVEFFDTVTRSEPFKCIAEDSRRWLKMANCEVSGG